eukprot:CAMPEP_0113518950 /NCGR_PEP_ID=MMETSP0014_2-20120614/43256_1 /TAXON_ID=2857 /ORGANISM="Nitzschia sp." /LENGTH=146 /DNA_ID=CAMNT_0000416629 /DNA_START=81 /DNA_END=522 /DNA_ORIENTATION=+ /assembly_acc=CAM_ASM_000159
MREDTADLLVVIFAIVLVAAAAAEAAAKDADDVDTADLLVVIFAIVLVAAAAAEAAAEDADDVAVDTAATCPAVFGDDETEKYPPNQDDDVEDEVAPADGVASAFLVPASVDVDVVRVVGSFGSIADAVPAPAKISLLELPDVFFE